MLFVLPAIREDWPSELKNGIAIRNACATEGVCPDCGARGEFSADADNPKHVHVTFQHEPSCAVVTDAALS